MNETINKFLKIRTAHLEQEQISKREQENHKSISVANGITPREEMAQLMREISQHKSKEQDQMSNRPSTRNLQ